MNHEDYMRRWIDEGDKVACSFCHTPLTRVDKFIIEDGNAYCSTLCLRASEYADVVSEMLDEENLDPTCERCGKVIRDAAYIIFNGVSYHSECATKRHKEQSVPYLPSEVFAKEQRSAVVCSLCDAPIESWVPVLVDGVGELLCCPNCCEVDTSATEQQQREEPSGSVRTFETGATRDSDAGKYDYEGFLSPLVIEAYGAYMHEHRLQSDGSMRDSDNWQKGIPRAQYMKSLWRHFVDLWFMHRGRRRYESSDGHELTFSEVCSAIMFNIMGYLHEVLTSEEKGNMS